MPHYYFAGAGGNHSVFVQEEDVDDLACVAVEAVEKRTGVNVPDLDEAVAGTC